MAATKGQPGTGDTATPDHPHATTFGTRCHPGANHKPDLCEDCARVQFAWHPPRRASRRKRA